jgi:nitrite reductase/ring-hydroxylating ferredoxin subunit
MPRFNVGLKESDFHEGKLALVKIGDNNLVLGLANGKIYAMDSVCSHEGGPLEEGTLKGYELTCPWHQGVFDKRNARTSSQTDWVTDLKSYTVFVDVGGEILIDTDINSANFQIAKNETQDRAINVLNLSLKPMKLEAKLMKKISYEGTDIMSFQFSRDSDQDYLQYIAGQYVLMDLGTSEDPEVPDRSFTLASSPTEKDHILISTRIRQTPFKQKLRNLVVGSIVNIKAPLGEFVLHEDNSQPVIFYPEASALHPLGV